MLLFLLWTASLAAQSRKELENKRKQLLVEIEQTSILLEQAKKNKSLTLERYVALQTQIRNRQQLVNTLNQEIQFTEASMARASEVLEALARDVERLKQEYATMIRIAYRHKLSNSFLLFLFSADSVNDAFRRWQYIKQYDKYRKKQARLIIDTQVSLQNRANQLEKRKEEKQKLLVSAESQKQLLKRELEDKDNLLATLKKDENRLVAELGKQQKSHQQLNNAIEKIIREEITRQKREARGFGDSAGSENKAPVVNKLSNEFENNKGRLPWPVNSGFISRRFGTQAHPTLKDIVITNNGIDIRTKKKAAVFSVFKGKVAGTQFIPGFKNTLILQHGPFYTVYSNLEEIFVKRGEQINGKQLIGRLGNDKPEVHFEVWREKQRLNPAVWVAKR